MKASKLEKLRTRLDEMLKKREQLNETIEKLQAQISEEENKEFRSVLDKTNLSFEEAVQLLQEEANQRQKSVSYYSDETETTLLEGANNHAII
ncbi:hypothetical protein [Enterococcus faecalis]|uniref:hypothetical protein n=1 Tax=Enterococcus faecalis TaxID=1351 RepID=UPI001A95C729|nr:hypothetical protein [Enterococcus faecalis]MBO1137175.1 DUF342 domain-containing protein [Enterococcus faecalis]